MTCKCFHINPKYLDRGLSIQFRPRPDAAEYKCFYKEVDKKHTGCNLKSTELLDSALIGLCAVIWSNMVIRQIRYI